MHIGQITSRESSKTPKIMSMRALFAGEGWTHRNCTSRMAPSFHASLLPMWAFPHAGKARGQEEVCVGGGSMALWPAGAAHIHVLPLRFPPTPFTWKGRRINFTEQVHSGRWEEQTRASGSYCWQMI